MKISQFTIIVDDYPQPGKHLAYNTRTQALLVLNDAIRSLLREMPVAVTAVAEEARPILTKLEEMGITLRDDADELDIMRDWFETIRYNSKKLEAYVLTTYFCNFACPYCFEGKVKEQKRFMSQEKAQEIVLWLKNKAMEVNPEKIEIVFYGGEPLLNVPMLEYIAREMHEWTATTPWHFEFNIITNGSLVTEALVDRLNGWGLKSLRITLDGDKEQHDQYRPFISGKGSFDILIRNIKAVAHKTKVILASNFNTHSYESLYKLLDFFEAEGLKEKIAMIDFKPITERRDPMPHDSQAVATYACDPGHGEKMIQIKKELMRRGFATSRSLDGGGVCHFKSGEHQVIIDPDGVIFKCPAMVGHYDKSCGNVSDLKLNDRYKDFMSFDLVEWKGKCQDCQYVPFCAGGCNYHAELQTGSYKNVFCERDFFDKTIHDYIKIKYEQLMAKKREREKQPALTV
ncbi:MAG: radical SAM protein [Candidatus Omnitrophica bacterium]|nr:radical SAM protein [Candidatus Omnitrophota bacterium]